MSDPYPDPWRPHGLALLDYFNGDRDAVCTLYSDYEPPDEFKVEAWFRTGDSAQELVALEQCRGHVLDVGAGTGVHALPLQERGLTVSAIDHVPEAVEIMRRRGVRDARHNNLYDMSGETFDTILILANGAGLAETLKGLDRFLAQLGRLLRPGGQVLLDSTDLRTDADRKRGRSDVLRDDGRYIGEIQFQLEYRGRKAPPFPQLYVDPDTFRDRASKLGWQLQVLDEGVGTNCHFYLARLTRDEARS